jgi:hypothetical protein
MMAESAVETVHVVVNRRALQRACARAAAASLARGGVYDLRGSALIIWPEEPASGLRGDPIGMVSWDWGVPVEQFATVHRVEAAPGHAPAEVLARFQRLLAPSRDARGGASAEP